MPKRVLVAGNSQARVLKLALPADRIVSDVQFDFHVIPGGPGPDFEIKNDRLVVGKSVNPKMPPYAYPLEAAEALLSDYDAILVSALGYVDGGFAYTNPITQQGLVAEYGPKDNPHVSNLISEAVMREVVVSGLERHAGVRFLKKVTEVHPNVIVQPFPNTSELVRDHPGWGLRAMYEDYLGFNRFLMAARDSALAHFCGKAARLLPPPFDVSSGFTPKHLMGTTDGLHAEVTYGGMVLRQVYEALA
jgi:hypothetical protein